jgi:hypothetical protein
MAIPKTITMKQLSDHLKVMIKHYGDRPIFMSSDAEGNSYGTIHQNSIQHMGDKNGSIVLVPWKEVAPEEFY